MLSKVFPSVQIQNLLAAFQRLSKREQYMICGLMGALVLFIAFLINTWVSSSLSELRKAFATKTTYLETIINLGADYERAKHVNLSSKHILRQGAEIKLMGTIESLAKQMGVDVEDMQRRTPTLDSENGIAENKVEVNIKLITIDQLVDFLQAIESRAKTIFVRNLRIKKNFQRPNLLEVNFTVSNFELMEEDVRKEHGE